MSTHLSQSMRDEVDAARIDGLKKKSRLRVEAGDRSYPLLKLGERGFVVEADEIPPMRGLVDIYDGARHMLHCLIIASERVGREMRYDFKLSTPAVDKAPLDYSRDPDAPVALLPQSF